MTAIPMIDTPRRTGQTGTDDAAQAFRPGQRVVEAIMGLTHFLTTGAFFMAMVILMM